MGLKAGRHDLKVRKKAQALTVTRRKKVSVKFRAEKVLDVNK